MATIVKSPSKSWKAVIRRQGWPTVSKSSRTKLDPEDWARCTEDGIIRNVYVRRSPSEATTVSAALKRYLEEVTPSKRPSTQRSEAIRAKTLQQSLGRYSLAALTPDIVASFRDQRLGEGKSVSTVRLEVALLGHLYTVAIKEWGLGLVYNPVANIRRPSPGQGRTRRVSWKEARRLLTACDAHSNSMLGWVVRIAHYTGMRQGEILSLTRDQIDVERRVWPLRLASRHRRAGAAPRGRRGRSGSLFLDQARGANQSEPLRLPSR